MYMEVFWICCLVADVDGPRPAMKSSVYEVDETLVGSLFQSLSLWGKTNDKGGLPSNDEKLGYASSMEVLVYVVVNMTDVDFVKETWAVVLLRWLLANHPRTDTCKTPSIYLVNPLT